MAHRIQQRWCGQQNGGAEETSESLERFSKISVAREVNQSTPSSMSSMLLEVLKQSAKSRGCVEDDSGLRMAGFPNSHSKTR